MDVNTAGHLPRKLMPSALAARLTSVTIAQRWSLNVERRTTTLSLLTTTFDVGPEFEGARNCSLRNGTCRWKGACRWNGGFRRGGCCCRRSGCLRVGSRVVLLRGFCGSWGAFLRSCASAPAWLPVPLRRRLPCGRGSGVLAFWLFFDFSRVCGKVTNNGLRSVDRPAAFCRQPTSHKGGSC